MPSNSQKLLDLERQLIDEDYKLAEESLRHFFIRAWNEIESEKYLSCWHLDLIADHLTAQAKGDPHCQNLIINLHPRLGKSLLCSVVYPAWLWLRNPSEKIMAASHTERLVVDLSIKCRSLITSNWYKTHWIDKHKRFRLTSDSNTKLRFDNNEKGYRLGVTPTTQILGLGYTSLIMDDLNSSDAIYSQAAIIKAVNFYKNVLRNRANNSRTARKLLIQQRLANGDITDYVLENEPGWTQVILPAEYEPKLMIASPIGRNDPRKKEGDLICPSRFDGDYYHIEKKNPLTWQAIYQQNPSGSDGAYVKTEYLKFTDNLPDISLCNDVILTVDLATESTQESNYSSFIILGRILANIYVFHAVRGQIDFPAQINLFKQLCHTFPVRAKIVERKSNGSPLIQMLENQIPGIHAVSPTKSKEERLLASLPFFTSGNIYFPNPQRYPWVQELIAELLAFPNGKYDDQVDAIAQGINYLTLERNTSSVVMGTNSFNETAEAKKLFEIPAQYQIPTTTTYFRQLFG
jgi:predicted phage terminase large subunit-like protein